MQRVTPSSPTPLPPGLSELRDHGIPDRMYLIDLGPLSEVFMDFSMAASPREMSHVEGIPEVVFQIGTLCFWMRMAGVKSPGLPLVVGAHTGIIWVLDEHDPPFIVNWSVRALERCVEHRLNFHRIVAESGPIAGGHAFADLVRDIVRLEPNLSKAPSGPLHYWQAHLEDISVNLDVAPYNFPWKT